ncbi:hypothetical protein LPJ66_000797 [Kickxella alabastrina]|uniref:Uncharacterized protein n=1 Tax=Kickxella alabastrina TaxID=61397 RepID=A0ACC1IV45_9FUNG|nr:hypothetical protein LPJ66_000797 [Kickxella alabastrina]
MTTVLIPDAALAVTTATVPPLPLAPKQLPKTSSMTGTTIFRAMDQTDSGNGTLMHNLNHRCIYAGCLAVYPGPTDDILEELKKRVDAHCQDKKLDLGMMRGWQELTEDMHTTLVKKLQGKCKNKQQRL